MRLLLDTHAFLWWITDSPELSETARREIANGENRVFWSVASTWEVGIKYALGRLPLPATPQEYLPRHLQLCGVRSIPISDGHAYRAAALPPHHTDPFDRMLVAQAQMESLRLVSADIVLRAYEVGLVW